MTLRTENRNERLLALALIAVVAVLRLAPHPSNFTPVAAAALFAGSVLPPAWALTVPLAAMMLTDWVIGLHSTFLVTWGLFMAVALIGVWVSRAPSITRIFAGTIGGSLLFFFVSNLAVFFVDRLYPMTAEGFIECFVMAVPFYRNTLLGDVFFTLVLFGAFALAKTPLSRLAGPQGRA